jgi:prephenate dehydratase
MFTTVAIQGQEASFHHIAARQFLGKSITPVSCDTFADTFDALHKGQAQQAVVAIENSLFGSINEVYDLLLKHKFWITGEVYLRIEQCLLGIQGATPEKVGEVYSHPIALAQCEQYLEETLARAKRFEHHDTSGAAADVRAWNNPTKAAIGSRQAAERFGLEVLAHEIETHKQNYTRFVVLGKDQQVNPAANKTSLILTMAERPGALYHALGAFAKQQINLTKLQSRPLIGKAWHYIFYVDVDAGLQQPAMQAALTDLKAQDCKVNILGSYTSGR